MVINKNTLTDAEIIELYFNRNESAIIETEKKYKNYLFTVAGNILSNDEDIQECLNDTYFRAWNAIPPARPKVFRMFLAKITRNLAFDRYDYSNRSKRISENATESLSDFESILSSSKSIDEEFEAKEIGRIINEYLKQTSDKRLYIFISRYYFAIPIKDIASKLSCSESSVNKEIKKIKEELLKKLNKEGIDL